MIIVSLGISCDCSNCFSKWNPNIPESLSPILTPRRKQLKAMQSMVTKSERELKFGQIIRENWAKYVYTFCILYTYFAYVINLKLS